MCSPECASTHAESYPIECRILGRLEEERSDLANPRQGDSSCKIMHDFSDFRSFKGSFFDLLIAEIIRNQESFIM